jgi:hypothetical protein
MKALFAATAFAALLGLAGVSDAAQIITPNVTAAATSDRAECIVVNAGVTPVTVTVKLLNETGYTEASYNCGGPLGPGQFCALNRPAAGIVGYHCAATASSIAKLRGSIVILEEQLDSYGLIRARAIRSAPME